METEISFSTSKWDLLKTKVVIKLNLFKWYICDNKKFEKFNVIKR